MTSNDTATIPSNPVTVSGMRILVAARLSKLADGQTGLETQDLESTRWALEHGHEVVHVAADRKSGTVQPWDRPGLRPWVTEPGKIAQYDAVVAYRFDRLSRGDKQSTNAIEKWAHDHGKHLLTVDGLAFPSEGAAGIQWDVTARIAHEEWLKASERYRRMQGWLRANGYLVGPPPWGFRIVALDGHKTLEPDPELAEIIREAVRRYLLGASLRDCCAWLDAQGIAPPKSAIISETLSSRQWQPVTLGRLFRNQSMIGRRKQRGTVLRHEPILDRGTWDRLQAELDRRASRTGIAPANTAMLTGIAQCGHCSGPLYRVAQDKKLADGSTRHYAYYRCHGTDTAPSTCKNGTGLDELESWLDAKVRAFPGTVLELADTPGPSHDDEIAEVKADIAELDPEADDYDEQLGRLRAELKRLRALPSGGTTGVVASYRIADLWAVLTPAQRRHYLLAAGVQVVVRKADEASTSNTTMLNKDLASRFRLDGDLSELRHSGWPGLDGPDPGIAVATGDARAAADARAWMERLNGGERMGER